MLSWLFTFIDFVLHIDVHLLTLIATYGILVYGILFLIIFCETGLVFTPFLPGDSLLFALGALAAKGDLNLFILFLLLALAAILGDTVNYSIGRFIGPAAVHTGKVPFINKEHLEKAETFYAHYGSKTIVLARFIPIIRTFVPFTAGVGNMRYLTFLLYNIIGGIVWISLFLFGGYYFGNIPLVKDHFSIVILTIVILSFIPAIIEYIRHKQRQRVPLI